MYSDTISNSISKLNAVAFGNLEVINFIYTIIYDKFQSDNSIGNIIFYISLYLKYNTSELLKR
jgi:hypothetical protein